MRKPNRGRVGLKAGLQAEVFFAVAKNCRDELYGEHCRVFQITIGHVQTHQLGRVAKLKMISKMNASIWVYISQAPRLLKFEHLLEPGI